MKIALIYFLYGEDTYRSRKKLNEIIGEYQKRAGADLNIHRLDSEYDDVSILKSLVETRSLFGPKKLVVVENAVSSSGNFDLLLSAARSAKDSGDVFLILWDRGLGKEVEKKIGSLKSVASKTQEFKIPRGALLKQWILEEAKKRDLKLSARGFLYLESQGKDLWAISNELDKMFLTNVGVGADKLAQGESSIFSLGDSFFTSRGRALNELFNLLDLGHDDFNIFSYLVNYTRTLFTIKHCTDHKREVPASCGIHPYVVKKSVDLLRSLEGIRLGLFLHRFFEEDHKIKTGVSKPKDSLIHIILNS